MSPHRAMEAAADPPRSRSRSRRRRCRKQRKEIQDHATTTKISELPSHITSDILSRLPLKSIFTCKRVCSSFRILTPDPYFPQLQLPRSPLCLILYRLFHSDRPTYFEFLPLDDSLVDLRRRRAPMRFVTQIDIGTAGCLSTCNGLICLSDYNCPNNVYVCNPITRQHFRLPESKDERHYHRLRYGLGYSRSADLFKVVRFADNYGKQPFGPHRSIYTLGVDDEWRTLGNACLPIPHDCSFVFLNGALHWIGWENSFHPLLCYFDLEKEQCGNLPLPSQFAGYGFHLGVVDNCLYVREITRTYLGPVNIWVMKDYGNIGSWTLEWIIQRPLSDEKDFNPIKTLEDGTVLMIVGKITLASYNPVSKVLEEISYLGVYDRVKAIVGLPSFLPLPGAEEPYE